MTVGRDFSSPCLPLLPLPALLLPPSLPSRHFLSFPCHPFPLSFPSCLSSLNPFPFPCLPTHKIQPGVSGSAVSSPSGSGRSPAAMALLVIFFRLRSPHLLHIRKFYFTFWLCTTVTTKFLWGRPKGIAARPHNCLTVGAIAPMESALMDPGWGYLEVEAEYPGIWGYPDVGLPRGKSHILRIIVVINVYKRLLFVYKKRVF